jgi:hypothetical protein
MKSQYSLIAQLTRFLKTQDRWVSGKELEDREWRKKNGATYKRSNASRRLRELAEGENPILLARGNPVEYAFNRGIEPPKPVYLVRNPFTNEMITIEEYRAL